MAVGIGSKPLFTFGQCKAFRPLMSSLSPKVPQVCWWDTRTGGQPQGEISLHVSHIEPVYKVKYPGTWPDLRVLSPQTIWISSKTNSEFFTASTDGTVRFLSSSTTTLSYGGSVVGHQEVQDAHGEIGDRPQDQGRRRVY